MASKQPHPSPCGEGEPAQKRPKVEATSPTKRTIDRHRVELNPADCDLDFDIDANGLQGSALHEKGFAYCWSGARATVGIRGGKYCFGCKIVSEQVVDMSDTPADQQHLARIGISRGDDSVGCLGETVQSFGFGGTGKFSSAGRFSEYGVKFGVGDTIVCAVDLENKPLATIGFSVNGEWLGVAREFDTSSNGLCVVDSHLKKLPWDSALFPHILLKNVRVQLQFSIDGGLELKEGYKPWNSAIEDGNAIFGPTFSSPVCEVLMMVGLPASGKTTWAEKWSKEHPEKRYVLLGTNLALDSMKVPGLLRKRNYGERFDHLMDRATGIFNTLLARAAKTPRNYILDQTNVYKSARNRKLKSFVKYRKIAVVVFPRPEEIKSRAAKRFEEMGKEVPAEAVNEMLANFILPTSKNMPGSTECFDEVIFPELARDETQRQLDEMKRALTSSSYLSTKHEFPSYSCESSVQSLPRRLVANKEPAKASGGHWQTPKANFSHSYYSSPSQAIPAYARPTFSAEHPPRTVDTHHNVPSDNPYERIPRIMQHSLDAFNSTFYLIGVLKDQRAQVKRSRETIKALEATAVVDKATLDSVTMRLLSEEGRARDLEKAEQLWVVERDEVRRELAGMNVECYRAFTLGQQSLSRVDMRLLRDELRDSKLQVKVLSDTADANRDVILSLQAIKESFEKRVLYLEAENKVLKSRVVASTSRPGGGDNKLQVEVEFLKKKLDNPEVLRDLYSKTKLFEDDATYYGEEGFKAAKTAILELVLKSPADLGALPKAVEDLEFDDVMNSIRDQMEGLEASSDDEGEEEGQFSFRVV